MSESPAYQPRRRLMVMLYPTTWRFWPLFERSWQRWDVYLGPIHVSSYIP